MNANAASHTFRASRTSSLRRMLWRCALLATSLSLAGTALAKPAADALLSYDFKQSAEPWVVLGNGAKVEKSADASASREGRGALSYTYTVASGMVHTLTLPIKLGSLVKARSLSFAARPTQTTSLIVSLEEQGGGHWTATVTVPGGKWTEVQLGYADFALSTGANDPPDSNNRLDMDRVRLMSVFDAGAIFASASSKMMEMFGIAAGPRELLIDNLVFHSGELAAPANDFDAFGRRQLMWSAFGINGFEMGTDGPLKQNGLALRYRKKPGAVMGLIRAVSRGSLAGNQALTLELASEVKTELTVKVEQADGGKFETTLKLPGDRQLHRYALDTREFKKSGDSQTRADAPNWAQVNQVIVMDIGGFFAARTDNSLWVQQVQTQGVATGTASGGDKDTKDDKGDKGDKGDGIERTVVATAGWAPWTKRVRPIHSGSFSLVGDPSVIKDGDIYRMVYTCYDPKRKGPAVCQATSPDGFDWTDVPVKDPVPGRMVQTRPGKWDDAHETPYLYKYKGEYLLYFVGYIDKGGFFKSFPGSLGLATSRDGVHFDRLDEPIMKPTPGGYDNEAIYSPSIVEYEGKLVMIYTAHCWTNCPKGKGLRLLAATSTDGRNWTKVDKPVMTKEDLPQTRDGAAEAEIVKGPDGYYYLFMSLMYGDENHDIGIARARTPFGPWDIDSASIVRRTAGGFDAIGPIAPSVIIEDKRVRMWFHGFSKRKTIEIGYAEAPWPLRLKP